MTAPAPVAGRIEIAAAGTELHLVRPGLDPGVVRFESRAGLPVASGSLDEIVDNAIAGGLEITTLLAWLRECRRVVRPGGTVRLVGLGDRGADEVAALRRAVEQLTGLLAADTRGDDTCHSENDLFLRRREAPCLAGETLVSVLVPAYRPDYLDEALRSATSQTWSHLEILVRDDCPDGSVAELVRRHASVDPRIRYSRNEPVSGARANYYGLFEHARGALVKYLNDDDVLHPDVVRRMVAVLEARPDVTLVTSHRRNIDANSVPIADDEPTRPMFDTDAVVPGPSAMALVFGTRLNWIGEPTTTMFRRSDVVDVEPELFAFADRPALANGDLTLWTRLLAHGDLCYLASTLSRFRRHGAQHQVDPEFHERALRDWDLLEESAVGAGLLGPGISHAMAQPLDDKPWWHDDLRRAAASAESLMAAAAESEEPEFVVRGALVALDAGEIETAMNELRRAAHLDPWDARAPALLSLVCAMVADLDGARAARRWASERAPGSDLVAEIDASIGAPAAVE